MLAAFAASALIVAAGTDIFRRVIPNALPLLVAIVGLSHVVTFDGALPALTRVALALVVFAAGFGAFVAGILGGGDVKLVTATAIWVPPDQLVDFAAVVAVTGAVLAVVVILARIVRERVMGQTLAAEASVPYGAAIAVGGCTILALTS